MSAGIPIGDTADGKTGKRPNGKCSGKCFSTEQPDAKIDAISEYRYWKDTHCYLLPSCAERSVDRYRPRCRRYLAEYAIRSIPIGVEEKFTKAEYAICAALQ